MEKFSTFFGLKLGHVVISVAEHLSCTLQGKDTTIQEAVEAAKLTESYLWILRSDEEYAIFYNEVVQASQDLTDEIILPRKQKKYHGASMMELILTSMKRQSVFTDNTTFRL